MKLDRITFTGIDERTDINRVNELSEKYPMVEWGILYSPRLAHEIENIRYPSGELILELLKTINGNKAVHLCGRSLNHIITRNGQGYIIFDSVRTANCRIQLNFKMKWAGKLFTDGILSAINDFNDVKFIVQANESNMDFINVLDDSKLLNVDILHDSSGGRGVEISKIEEPHEFRYTGYAGGIGIDNVLDIAKIITNIDSPKSAWIDMESSIRKHKGEYTDVLNLDICEAILHTLKSEGII